MKNIVKMLLLKAYIAYLRWELKTWSKRLPGWSEEERSVIRVEQALREAHLLAAKMELNLLKGTL